MAFHAPPAQAAWRHRDARDGFEVVFIRRAADGWHVEGHTAAVEDGAAWAVHYAIDLDAGWITRAARVATHGRDVTLTADGVGHWRLDGEPAAHLDGLLDVDLEASAFTNAFPVHRLALAPGQSAQAPAAYVRLDLAVERLEQHYTRLPDDGPGQRYDYVSPAFDFRCELRYDASGLVLDYPGIAVRAA